MISDSLASDLDKSEYFADQVPNGNCYWKPISTHNKLTNGGTFLILFRVEKQSTTRLVHLLTMKGGTRKNTPLPIATIQV